MSLSVHGLLDALRAACSIAAGSDTRFCFLLDGLDEYEGQANDMIEFIARLNNLPNVKMCVSSRPWNEFEREFGKDRPQKLYMQDYNGTDIENYVYDTLDKDDNYQELEDKEISGKLLVEEIVQAANGVFLWVFLVVRSFREGLENGDRVSDLRERLRKLPNDLNEYFNRIILSDVEEFYHGHSAEMFMVTLNGDEDIPLMAYWFIREDSKYVSDLDRKPLSMQQFNKRLKDTTKRLNASCKGLLEVRHLMSQDSSLPSSILFERKVGFLHRTVREYLMLNETRSVLQNWCSSGFDPHESLCKMLLAQIKISPDDYQYSQFLIDLGKLLRRHRNLIPSTLNQTIVSELTDDYIKILRAQDTFADGQEASPTESKDTDQPVLSCSSKEKDKKGKISKLIGRMRGRLHKSLRQIE
ncbi:Nn.00g022760.m01.CDS01 [Neocucurbitaria sp. VM-36]